MSKKARAARSGEVLAVETAANQLPELVRMRVLDALYHEEPAAEIVAVSSLVLDPAFQMRVAISDWWASRRMVSVT